MDLTDWIFIASVTLFLVELWAVVGILRLRSSLRGKVGFRLATILVIAGAGIAVGQALSVISTGLLNFVDVNGSTQTLRLAIILARQIIGTAVMLWALFAISRLASSR